MYGKVISNKSCRTHRKLSSQKAASHTCVYPFYQAAADSLIDKCRLLLYAFFIRSIQS